MQYTSIRSTHIRYISPGDQCRQSFTPKHATLRSHQHSSSLPRHCHLPTPFPLPIVAGALPHIRGTIVNSSPHTNSYLATIVSSPDHTFHHYRYPIIVDNAIDHIPQPHSRPPAGTCRSHVARLGRPEANSLTLIPIIFPTRGHETGPYDEQTFCLPIPSPFHRTSKTGH